MEKNNVFVDFYQYISIKKEHTILGVLLWAYNV